MNVPSASDAFGDQLRYWRRVRGLSQLALAAEARTTPRHVSFLETGRSRPGADVVARLADALAVPLRERNRLLSAAGLRPAHDDRELTAPDLAPLRAVVQRMLDAHAPFPAFVFDRHLDIVMATSTGRALLAGSAEPNLIRLLFADDGAWRSVLDNFEEVAAHALALLRDDALELLQPGDPRPREVGDQTG